MIFKIFKIFASNIFSFDFGSKSVNSKKKSKPIFRGILVGLLFLYVLCSIGFTYISAMLGLYKYLASVNQTSLMPVIGLTMGLSVILFFGFTSVATNYYTGHGEEQIMAMPLTPVQLFGAKFMVSFVTDAVMGIILFSITAAIYGYHEGLLGNPLFYVGTVLLSVSSSVCAIGIIYLLLILILLWVPALRKKTILTGIASVLIIIFVGGFSLMTSKLSTAATINEAQAITNTFEPVVGMVNNVTASVPFIRFISDAMNGKIIPILVLLAIGGAVVFGFIPLLGKLYVKTLDGFADIKTKKMTSEQTNKMLRKENHSQSITKALFWRDVKTVLREPAFFGSGPILIFIMPFIFIISFAVGFSSVSDLKTMTDKMAESFAAFTPEKMEKYCYYIVLVLSIFTTFVGNSSSIAVSSFSREGKALYDLKAMPIKNNIIIKVKFWHAFSYIAICDILNIVLMIVVKQLVRFPVSFQKVAVMALLTTLVSISISVLVIFIDMAMDTAKPKLNWENPIAAFKQNLNSMAAVFISMGIAAILFGLGFVLPKNNLGLLIITVVFAIISAPVGSAYFKFAERRISEM